MGRQSLMDSFVEAVRQVWISEERVAAQNRIVDLLTQHGRNTTAAREELVALERVHALRQRAPRPPTARAILREASKTDRCLKTLSMCNEMQELAAQDGIKLVWLPDERSLACPTLFNVYEKP